MERVLKQSMYFPSVLIKIRRRFPRLLVQPIYPSFKTRPDTRAIYIGPRRRLR